MLRRPISDSENIPPPSNLQSRTKKNPKKQIPSARNPLTPRNQLPKSKPNTSHSLKPSFKSTQSSATASSTRPRRRPALGDITNKRNANHPPSQSSVPSRLKSPGATRAFKHRPPPVDSFGNIESPHIVPHVSETFYEPPMLFDQAEITDIFQRKDKDCRRREQDEEDHEWARLLGRDCSVDELVLDKGLEHDHDPARAMSFGVGGGITLDEMLQVGELVLDEGGRD